MLPTKCRLIRPKGARLRDTYGIVVKMKLKDKTFIVYGASSGIGQALAIELAKYNRVGTFSRREMKTQIPQSIHFQGDVTKPDDIRQSSLFFKEKWGQIDGFFYSVGIGKSIDLHNFQATEARNTMEVNYFGFLNVLETWLPDFLSRKSGLVAMVSALMVHRSLPKGASYFASKAAQHVFFEGLRLDLEFSGLDFFEIRPGLVDTPMSQDLEIDRSKAWGAQKSAQFIVNKIESGETTISFSKAMELLTKSLNWMPDKTYFKLVKTSLNKTFKK